MLWRVGVSAVAAALALAFWLRPPPGWPVVALAGRPTVDGREVAPGARLRSGQTLETGPEARAKLLIGRIGEVDLEPGSGLRLVEEKSHRLALDHGALRAFIWAPPRTFSVKTKEALAVDLGCAYSLRVDRTGEGLLQVAFGWVSFDAREREVYVPAGAACALHAGKGAGTPYFEDADAGFRQALALIDQGRSDEATLGAFLAAARPRDAFTLLQVMDRLPGPERARVYDRLTALVPPPRGVEREAMLAGDMGAKSAFWASLGLGEMKWWQLGPGLTPRADRAPDR
jgi:hypothetical protein